MPRTEEVYDEFCPWPYGQPYGLVKVKIVKLKTPRKPRRRSPGAAALALPIYRPKKIPNKKSATKRGKITLKVTNEIPRESDPALPRRACGRDRRRG